MLRNLTIGISRSQIKRLIVFAANLSLLPQDVFTPLRDYSFTLLDFSGNKVNALYPFVFSNLTLLDQLVLSYNKIATIEPNFFDGMQALKVLKIDYNGVRSINTGKHTWTINLTELYLSGNLLTVISKFAFLGLQNLTLLDLSYNKRLSIIRLSSFTGLNNIHTVDLSRCNLESLQKLNLSGNNLKQIRTGLLTGLGQIRSITLDGNIIAYLDEGTFLNNSRLTNLSLANNRLTSLNESTFRPIYSSLSLVDLSQNSLVCSCDLEWLLDWLNQNGTVSLVNEEQTLCAPLSLAPLREKPLLHFNPPELCRFNYAIFSLIPIVIVSLVVFLVLVYYKRWKLKYKLFLLKLAVIGYRERQDARNHNDYEFDVIPGMYYLDAVDYVVSRSYKTIILLSRAAVRDRWFMLKFRTAMDHVSDTQTEFVVVVFLEDIPDDEIPFLARLFLSDGRPYLHWTEDVRGQEYFWKELAKNLTINLRTNDLIPNE
eukprot:XP_011670125.1 PREDICTED: slit homolog 3 protein-like [Strongylocentrotus purpuratus]